MKAWEKKFQTSLIEAIKLDDARLEDEMKNTEPHVFSESFEKRMEEVMKMQKRKSRAYSFSRSVAVIVLLFFLSGGVLLGSSEQLRASVASIDILSWVERFFTVGESVNERRDAEVLFNKSQLGYVPEGFKLVLEEELFSRVYYKYQNEVGEYFYIRVLKDASILNIDNEEVLSKVTLNAAGYEYNLLYGEDDDAVTIIWQDKSGIYYILAGIVESKELIRIMDEISY